MKRLTATLSILTLALATLRAQTAAPPASLFARHYVEGQRLVYLMNGQNNGRTYEVRIVGTVKKGTDGRLMDEFAFESTDPAHPLPPAAAAFRIGMTLDGGTPFAPPDLSHVYGYGLIGPITDLMTFYADLFLANHAASLHQTGDHVRVPSPTTGSWADGTVVVLGEDAVDFDLSVTRVSASDRSASLLVRHMVPAAPKIRLPAPWMQTPVADTPNNWVQVEKTAAGYTASVGKETFDVTITTSLDDGHIIAATIDNPVTAEARSCTDAALTACGAPRPDPTIRHIELALQP